MTGQRLEQMSLTLIHYSWHLTLESHEKSGFSPQQMLYHLLPASALSERLETAITWGFSLSSSRQCGEPRSKEKPYSREGGGRVVLLACATVEEFLKIHESNVS